MKQAFTYQSGEQIQSGDHITYHGESGKVEFVVHRKIGDPAVDWYAEQFPGGGFMIGATNFGSVFVTWDKIDEDLQFVSRG